MEKIAALLALCVGISPVTGEFPPQRPVMWSFDFFFDLRLKKRLSKQWGRRDLRCHRAHYDFTLMPGDHWVNDNHHISKRTFNIVIIFIFLGCNQWNRHRFLCNRYFYWFVVKVVTKFVFTWFIFHCPFSNYPFHVKPCGPLSILSTFIIDIGIPRNIDFT